MATIFINGTGICSEPKRLEDGAVVYSLVEEVYYKKELIKNYYKCIDFHCSEEFFKHLKKGTKLDVVGEFCHVIENVEGTEYHKNALKIFNATFAKNPYPKFKEDSKEE